MADVPCPSVYVERIGFEMDKSYEETKLQVLISPAVLIAKDNVEVGIKTKVQSTLVISTSVNSNNPLSRGEKI